MVLAITARRSCLACSASVRAVACQAGAAVLPDMVGFLPGTVEVRTVAAGCVVCRQRAMGRLCRDVALGWTREGQGLCPWTSSRGSAHWIPAKGGALGT